MLPVIHCGRYYVQDSGVLDVLCIGGAGDAESERLMAWYEGKLGFQCPYSKSKPHFRRCRKHFEPDLVRMASILPHARTFEFIPCVGVTLFISIARTMLR
eukprot:SAG31_NODE_992_length_10517_cov_6.577942_15_plen_100_part_00